ncbi:SAM-dependent methyltransferase [Massilia sp. UYP32]|uniref:class I SAM-dependent methyltransferase n=1 Tax=Massilia sp. UYP32 TaxID=1756386 RepID=UPI003D1A8D11
MTKDHWENYYQNQHGATPPPSQFAAFIAAEYGNNTQIFDLGCGNGRDTVFFSQYSSNVIGVDGSEAAVHAASALTDRLGRQARFIHALVEDERLPQKLTEHKQSDMPVILYSRFFLHAITAEQEQEFFNIVTALCSCPGDIVALEFRTIRDRDLPKVTSAHYRRYIDPISVITAGCKIGLTVEYFVEGFGYAKYKNDDAYVARVIFKRP